MLRASVLLILLLFGCGDVEACPSRTYAGVCVVASNDIPPPPTPTPTPTPTATPTPSGLPSDYLTAKATWETNMTTHGATWCEDDEGGEPGGWYYDGYDTYQQIRTYTDDSATWTTCVNHYSTLYKGIVDTQQSPGPLAGRRAFADGFHRAGDTSYISKLINNTTYSNMYHNCSDPDSAHEELVASREIAFLLNSLIRAAQNSLSSPWTIQDIDPADQCTNLGNTHTVGVTDALQFVKWHVERFINDSTYVQPFMAGLSANALILYEETYPGVDVAVPVLIKQIADFLWTNTWEVANAKFQYCWLRSDGSICLDPSDNLYSADLNMLIAPIYAWLYKKGYGSTYADRFDDIFIGGVNGAVLNDKGKTFTQNYWKSIQAVAWREAGPS